MVLTRDYTGSFLGAQSHFYGRHGLTEIWCRIHPFRGVLRPFRIAKGYLWRVNSRIYARISQNRKFGIAPVFLILLLFLAFASWPALREEAHQRGEWS